MKKFIKRFLITLAVIIPAAAFAADLVPLTISDFSAGLQTKKDSTYIDNGAAQDLQNVDVNTGRIQKRRGSVLQNSSTLGGFSQPVRFVHEFPDSSSNFWLLSVSSNTLFKSNDGGAANTIITSTCGITSSSRFSAINAYGKCRLTDGTTNWIIYDGTNLTISTASKKGALAEFFAERAWTADLTNDRSTLYASRYGDLEDWTDEGIDDADATSMPIRKDNGYPIRCLKRFRNGLLIFKDYSIDFLTYNSDGLTFSLTPISNEIGTQHRDSVQVIDNVCIFLSAKGFYEYDGASLTKISSNIDPTVYSVRQLFGGQMLWTQTTASDWAAGTLGLGLSTSVVDGDIRLSSVTLEDFSDGDISANPSWDSFFTYSAAGSTVSYYNGKLRQYANYDSGSGTPGFYYRSVVQSSATFTTSYSTGIWSADLSFYMTESPSAQSNFSITLWVFNGTTDSSPWARVEIAQSLVRFTVSSQTVTAAINADNYNDGVDRTISMQRDGQSQWTVKYGTITLPSVTCSSVSYSSFNTVRLKAQALSSALIAGTLITTLDNVRFSPSPARYISPSRATTNIISWGQLSADTDLDGGTASYAVYADSDTSINVDDTTTFISSQSVTNAQTPIFTSSNYAVVVATLAKTSISQIPALSELRLGWYLTQADPPVASVSYEGDYLCAVAISSMTANDTVLVYDRFGNWTKYSGLDIYSTTLYRQRPYYGSNQTGNIYRYQVDGLYSDNGAVIDSYWISKDFDFGYPITNKQMLRYYVTAQRNTNSDVVFSYGVNKPDTLTSVTLDLDSVTGFFRQNIIPSSLTYQKGITHRVKISDSDVDDSFDILSITLNPRLETAP